MGLKAGFEIGLSEGLLMGLNAGLLTGLNEELPRALRCDAVAGFLCAGIGIVFLQK